MAKAETNHNEEPSTGQKHDTEHDAAASPDPKRTKTEKQQTLEETIDKDNHSEENEEKDAAAKSKPKSETKSIDKDESAVEPGEEPQVPSNILEKGIVYFFIRGRVGIDDPSTVNDIARSYILLRPIEKDAKLGQGPIGDAGNTRLMALPKKTLPLSGKDRFMIFVEKSGASFADLKESFLASADYETKTMGTRHTPAATPVGEGVYAITTTGRESHLAYMLTLPEKLGEVQKELGLKEKGSFIISTKNPNYKGPANARLPQGPNFPKKIIDEFRSLRWLPSRPEHLDYPNAQILLVGESSGIRKALEPQKEGQKGDDDEDAEEPEEALENLEEEDLERMRHLTGDQSESIYADLQAQKEGYPKLQTTF